MAAGREVGGKTLIDVTRLVVNTEISRIYPELIYVILRLPFLAADYFKVDVALAAVRAEHMAFYQRVLRYTVVSQPRPYLQLTKPLGLMMADFRVHKLAAESRFPFFISRPGEMQSLFAGLGVQVSA